MAAVVVGATPQEAEIFIEANKHELNGDALEVFKKMSPQDQKRVINDGGLRDCNNVVAVIKTRARKARDMEQLLTGGRPLVAPQPEVAAQVFVPEPTMEIAQFYIRGVVQEVEESERRFASAATTQAKEDEEEDGPMEGTARGVGGVVEVMKAKYGCGSGQRLRVIGQTSSIWQCEGGRTVPKGHANVGWRWIVKGETEEPPQKQEAANNSKEKAVVEKKEERVEGKKEEDAASKKSRDKENKKDTKSKKRDRKSSKSRSSSRGRSKKKTTRKRSTSSSTGSSEKRKKEKRRRNSKSSESKSKKRKRKRSSTRSDSRRRKKRRKSSSSS